MRHHPWPAGFFLALLLLSGLCSRAQEFNLYYGLLHAHTAFSDGSGTPEEAFRMAKGEGIDFFAVTPHNHASAEAGAKERADGLLVATDHSLYNGSGNLRLTQHFRDGTTRSLLARSVIAAARAASGSAFSALYGQEFSTISSGNHANVFGLPDVIVSREGDYRALFATLAAERARTGLAPVVQLNHPDVRDDLSGEAHAYNDYGIDSGDLGPHFRDWVAAVDEYVSLIELLTGPAMKKAARNDHRYSALENDYYFYLTQGLHVSPSAGQDNHYRNWGTSTPARTGIYALSNAPEDLYAAMRANRTFATEDLNLAVELRVNGQFMGETVFVRPDDELLIEVRLTDADEPDAKYTISLVSGQVSPVDVREAMPASAKDGVLEVLRDEEIGGRTLRFSPLVAAEGHVFFYVTARQLDGDRIWSAPVWVTTAPQPVPVAAEGGAFAWTSGNSRLYHLRDCPSVRLIKPENLVTGDAPPENRRQHACTVGR